MSITGKPLSPAIKLERLQKQFSEATTNVLARGEDSLSGRLSYISGYIGREYPEIADCLVAIRDGAMPAKTVTP